MTAKIEPWIECAVWEIDSRCLETGAFFNRNQAANIIAAHAPKETGIKPDNAQAARHEPEYDPEQSETLAMLKKSLPHKFEQEPNVPVSVLKKYRDDLAVAITECQILDRPVEYGRKLTLEIIVDDLDELIRQAQQLGEKPL